MHCIITVANLIIIGFMTRFTIGYTIGNFMQCMKFKTLLNSIDPTTIAFVFVTTQSPLKSIKFLCKDYSRPLYLRM